LGITLSVLLSFRKFY